MPNIVNPPVDPSPPYQHSEQELKVIEGAECIISRLQSLVDTLKSPDFGFMTESDAMDHVFRLELLVEYIDTSIAAVDTYSN